MHVVIAPGRLKEGITEAELLSASDRFQREFVVDHPGVLRRVLVTDDDGYYADIVFFESAEAIQQVMVAEQTSEVCHQFMGLWEDGEVTSYRVLQTHD